MNYFEHDNVRLSFFEKAPRENNSERKNFGETIFLIHGFASSARKNWVSPGWVDYLTDAGYRVIASDHRGHGDSEKIYDSAAYFPELMADDIAALFSHLNLEKAHIMGYSMGARVAAFLALRSPDLVHSVIFGGLGIGMVEGSGDWSPVLHALTIEDPSLITHPRGRMFRRFAEHTKSDRLALAACVLSSKKELTESEVRRITQPALVVVGAKDELAGSPERLAKLLPHGEFLLIPDRDHMLAVGDKLYKRAVLQFLESHPFVDSS